MQSIVLEKPRKFLLREDPQPAPSEGEALVRVRRIGVCGTDLHAFEGHQPYFSYPRILGHELSVEIMEIGENPQGLGAGESCVINPYLACGQCVACRLGKANCCADLKVMGVHVDGGMREIMTVPQGNLIRAGELSFDQAALVENQCIGAHAVRRAGLKKGEHTLVIGAGPIGLGVIQFAVLEGARVTVTDINPERMAFCGDHFNVEHLVEAGAHQRQELEAITSGAFFTSVFEVTGNPGSMMKAIDHVAHGGRMILVGLVQADIRFFHPDFHKREMTLKSSRNAVQADFEHVIRSLEDGRATVDPFLTHRTSFDRVIQEFETWLEPDTGVIKAMVDVS
jgi:2-desacetyl-2-hydroxyethyl bacteriochlorophyllide A dehydrogenase